MYQRGLAAFAGVLLAAGGAALLADKPPPDKAKPPAPDRSLADLVEPIRARHKLPALGVAVVNGKGLAAVAVVGVRKRGTKVAATANDIFHVGSNTKALTATMLASLVEEGKLGWERPWRRPSPSWPGR